MLQRNYFSKCATVISDAGSTRKWPTIGSPSICETATAINSRQRAMLSGRMIDPVLYAYNGGMSALGQKQTFWRLILMSAYPQKLRLQTVKRSHLLGQNI